MSDDRVSLVRSDAEFLIRAAERWYEGLEEATRHTSEGEIALADLGRVQWLKKRLKIGPTAFDQMIATAKSMSVTDLLAEAKARREGA